MPPTINATASSSTHPQVVVGDTMTLYCHVAGVPSPELQWLVNGRPIDPAHPRLRMSDNRQQLDILDSELSDAGRYSCIAKNDAGITDRDFDLQVLGTFSVIVSDGARCLRVGEGGTYCSTQPLAAILNKPIIIIYTENRTYRRPFTSAIHSSLVGNPGALPSPEKKLNLGLAEMQFPTVLMSLGYLHSLVSP